MRKYIKSTRGNLVYEIERQSFTERFRTPEDYFTHATRNVWYSTTGFNMFVQYKGAFYMIDRTDAHGYITSLEFSPVTAEEAAAAKMERAAQAMSEAQEHEAKTAAAALDYDTETAEAEAHEARFSADYAEILAREAAELAAEAGTSSAASIAEAVAEYAERARFYAISAEETAEKTAEDLIKAYAEAIGEPTPAHMAKSARLVFLAQEAGGERPAPVHYDTVNLMQKVAANHKSDPDALRELFEDLKAGAVYGHQVNNVRYPFFWENLSMSGELIRWSSAGSSANAVSMNDLAFVVFTIFKTTPREFMSKYERR